MKKIFGLLLASLMLVGSAVSAFADGHTVTFDGSNLTPSYTNTDITEQLNGIQPGDETTVSVSCVNKSDVSVDWYIKNTVAQTLEDTCDGSDGAYTYDLSFDGTSLISSDKVGGKDSNGLADVSSDEWLYLGTIPAGQSKEVTLTVGLDGHSIGNSYFDSLAELDLNFAVRNTYKETEKTETKETVIYTSNPNTGDEGSNNHSMIFFGCGLLVLLLALVSFKLDRKEAK